MLIFYSNNLILHSSLIFYHHRYFVSSLNKFIFITYLHGDKYREREREERERLGDKITFQLSLKIYQKIYAYNNLKVDHICTRWR